MLSRKYGFKSHPVHSKNQKNESGQSWPTTLPLRNGRLRPVLRADIVVNLVVIPLGIKRRVNVAEVNGLVLDLAAQDLKVVTVEKLVFAHRLRYGRPSK